VARNGGSVRRSSARLYDGKREVRIYDYADVNVPMLGRMFDRRCRGHEVIGYTILLPASAIPGWPADVMLPSTYWPGKAGYVCGVAISRHVEH
jgi:hypothetical protein